jgi:gamma-glutamylcyclotransferase (GGCT)/AIG2-like uncharacterized protein YtfP
MLFAVNGTLMRGCELNQNMHDAGARFVRQARTAPIYRCWSIDDGYIGMLRVATGGAHVSVEIWDVDEHGLVHILQNEPPGLTIGRVVLEDQTEVLGVLAEPYATAGRTDITHFGGWREYMASKSPEADEPLIAESGGG